MSNVKAVHVTAVVPFHWMQPAIPDLDPEGLPESDVAFVASLLLGPSVGLHHDYHHAGYVPNENGGKTSMYRLEIGGCEAISFSAFDRLCDIIGKVGTIESQQCIDIEGGETP